MARWDRPGIPHKGWNYNELFAGNGMIGYVAKERVDGKLILPEAVQILKLKSE